MPAIPVTVEWARWGKTSSDRGYRLLRHSGGVLGEEHFNELFTRYSPGTLDRLPQVTASWLKHAGRYYLAVATHAEAEGGLYDATGRDVVVTSYFCVPFDQVVPAAVPYQVMYAAFRDIQALPDDGRPIALDLDIPELATPDDDRAVRVAALLLTDKPVCILGAEQAGLAQRLRFVDAVASLLPYGMRTRLSVSTWVSSTFRGHKFRLFFAHAPRGADDYVVDWHRPDHTPIGHLYADEYLDWLRNEIRRPVLQLAAEIVPVGFSRRDVLEMLEMLQRPGPSRPGHAPGAARGRAGLPGPWRTGRPGPHPEDAHRGTAGRLRPPARWRRPWRVRYLRPPVAALPGTTGDRGRPAGIPADHPGSSAAARQPADRRLAEGRLL